MDEQLTDHDTQDSLDALNVESTMYLQPASNPGGPVHRARASLIVLAGWEIGKEIEVSGKSMILGRSIDCDTCINSPSVSRQHSQIELVEENGERYFRVTDLGSSNGTHVNNTRTATTRLHDGDKVKMGDVLFKFVLQDEIDSQFHQQVHRLIHYDQLTGLLTMEAFRTRLEEELRLARPGMNFCLAMTDLDGLKKINDTYGHLAGRMVVGGMGRLIRESVRQEDHAGLYGGDEAIILFPNATLEEALAVAEQLRTAIESHLFDHHGQTVCVTISQGLAEYPSHGTTPEALIGAADRALYAAKAAGRNCVRTAPYPEV
jgi:diguanylate cyclase (GGDEF)-like protein